MWRESAFTKNMDECGRLVEGRTRDRSPLSPTSTAASTEGLKRQQSRSDPTVCERLRRKGDKKYPWVVENHFSFRRQTQNTPVALQRKELLLTTAALKWFYWSGVPAEWLWQQFGVWRQEEKEKFWYIWSLLIELKVLPNDSSWCGVKTATKPSLSCNI